MDLVMSKMKTRDLVYIAVAVVLLAVSAWISFPVGNMAFTMQTAALFVVASLLGLNRSMFAVGAYILLGLTGVPVFTGFSGGITKLMLPTGGFILGFFPLTIIVGVASDMLKKHNVAKTALYQSGAMLAGLLACYLVGSAWLACFISHDVGFLAAFTASLISYLPLDLAKIALAIFVSGKLKKYIK